MKNRCFATKCYHSAYSAVGWLTLSPICGVTYATTRPFLHLSCHLSPARSPMQIICPTALIWLELSDTYCEETADCPCRGAAWLPSLQIAGRHGNLQHMPHRTRKCEAGPSQSKPIQSIASWPGMAKRANHTITYVSQWLVTWHGLNEPSPKLIPPNYNTFWWVLDGHGQMDRPDAFLLRA